MTVGALTVIHSSSIIGDGSQIGTHCVIGHPAMGTWSCQPLEIGPRSNIRAHTILYEASTFGANLETGHHVLIREGTIAGEGLRAGGYTDIEGRCKIGDFCTLHSATIVGQGSTIGDFVWMFPNTVLPNDPLPPSPIERGSTLGSGSVMCTGSVLLPGTVLGEGAYVTAMSIGKGKIPAGAVIAGTSGRIVAHVTKVFSRELRLHHPWTANMTERYPERARKRLEQLDRRIRASAESFRLPG